MLFVLLLPVLLLVYYYYRRTVPQLPAARRVLLLVLRFLSIIILLLLLLNPIIAFRRNIQYYPEVVFLTDNSRSMELLAGERSKAEIFTEYRNLLKQKVSSQDYRLKEFSFADGIDGEKTSSNLSLTLQHLSDRVQLGNVNRLFLLSDGWFSDENLDIISRLNIPITTIHPEYSSDEFDIGINRLIYNRTAYTDEEVTIIADVFAENFTKKAELSLTINDRVIAKKAVDFSQNTFQQISFTHTFRNAGLFPFRIDIYTDSQDEVNLANNTYPGAIRVQEKRSGTFILTDRLLWDVRFLNNALRRDDRKDVAVFRLLDGNIFAGREQVSIGDVFPEHLRFLIIVNSGNLSLQPQYLELINRFVANGGGLLFIGKPLSAMQDILAATTAGIDRQFRSTLSFTPDSKKYQTFMNINQGDIPPVEYFYVSPFLHSVVLARFNNDEQSAAIMYHEYQKGRVLYLPFLNLWRWQLRAEGNHYNTFVDNLASWLGNPAGIDFFAQTDKNSYFLGETVSVTLTALDETLSIHSGLSPKLSLYNSSKQLVKEEFMNFDGQVYNLRIAHLTSDEYSFEINEETISRNTKGSFIISEIDAESRNKGFNYPLLSYISRQTGGDIFYDDTLSDFAIDQAERKSETVRREIPLYRHWLIISLFLFAFCLELYLRKRWGLL